jgi:hypothetical protein
MDKNNPPPAIRPAKAIGCSLWAPIIPVPGIARDSHDAKMTTLDEASAGSETLFPAAPEDIEGR